MKIDRVIPWSSCEMLFLVLLSCHSWSPTKVPAPGRTLEGNPSQVRVVLMDGTAMVLRNPSLSADTLTGDTRFDVKSGSVRIAIPTTRIKTLEVPRVSGPGTAGLIVALGIAAFVAFVVLAATGMST